MCFLGGGFSYFLSLPFFVLGAFFWSLLLSRPHPPLLSSPLRSFLWELNLQENQMATFAVSSHEYLTEYISSSSNSGNLRFYLQDSPPDLPGKDNYSATEKKVERLGNTELPRGLRSRWFGPNPEKMPRGRFWKVLEGLDTLLGEVRKEEGQEQVTLYRLQVRGRKGEDCLSTPKTRSWEDGERNAEYVSVRPGARHMSGVKLQKSHYLRVGGVQRTRGDHEAVGWRGNGR